MDSIEVTYKLEWFRGSWVVWECYDGVEDMYFHSASFEEAHAVFLDLHPETL